MHNKKIQRTQKAAPLILGVGTQMMTELSYQEKLTFWLNMAQRAERFNRTENRAQPLYDRFPRILLIGAIIGFIFAVAAVAGGLPLRMLVTIFAIVLLLLLLALIWLVLNSCDKTIILAARLKSILTLSYEDTKRIENYFEYQKQCIPKLQRVGCLTLPGGILIALSDPTLIELMVLLLIFVGLPLLIALGWFMYSFLKEKYEQSDADKIPEIRRFISSQAFGALWFSLILTLALIPMHVLLDICIYYSHATHNAEATDVFALVARVLSIVSFICWSPAVVVSAVLTLMPLQLVMGVRILRWYLSAVIALSVLLAIPAHLSMKATGIVAYLAAVNYLTTPRTSTLRASVSLLRILFARAYSCENYQ